MTKRVPQAATRLGLAAAALAFTLARAAAQAPEVDPALLELAREPAPLGWASVEGGTTGGAAASEEAIHVVATRAELVAALGGDNASNAGDDTPAIIFVSGTIDLTADDAGKPLGPEDFADPEYDWDAYVAAYDPASYGMESEPAGPQEDARARSQANQAAHTVINVGSNKTLFGLGDDAVIRHGTLNLDGVSNVVVRNVRFEDSYDMFPAWDGTDGAEGNWNSEYDLIQIRDSDHVWIDHATFTDGDRPDHLEPQVFGRPVQHHDGAVDVVNGSSFVTLSWNHVQDHDKTHLIGSSDRREEDRGRLKVTLHHDFFENSGQRSPRVRYGQVHVFNNLYVSDGEPPYDHVYVFGLGVEGAILSENNAFEMAEGIDQSEMLIDYKGEVFRDRGSVYNGEPAELLAAFKAANPDAAISPEAGWEPPYDYALEPAATVAASVREGAGAGRLTD
jgi:pectate lyase